MGAYTPLQRLRKVSTEKQRLLKSKVCGLFNWHTVVVDEEVVDFHRFLVYVGLDPRSLQNGRDHRSVESFVAICIELMQVRINQVMEHEPVSGIGNGHILSQKGLNFTDLALVSLFYFDSL